MEVWTQEDVTIVYAVVTSRAELMVTNTHYKLKGIQSDLLKCLVAKPLITNDCPVQGKRCCVSIQLLGHFRVIQNDHGVSVNSVNSEHKSEITENICIYHEEG